MVVSEPWQHCQCFSVIKLGLGLGGELFPERPRLLVHVNFTENRFSEVQLGLGLGLVYRVRVSFRNEKSLLYCTRLFS